MAVNEQGLNKVLMIDSDLTNQRLLTNLLSEIKVVELFIVDGVNDGIHSTNNETYDLIFLDGKNNEQNLSRLISSIRDSKYNAFTPIIIATGSSQEPIYGECLIYESVYALAKPLTQQLFGESIKTIFPTIELPEKHNRNVFEIRVLKGNRGLEGMDFHDVVQDGSLTKDTVSIGPSSGEIKAILDAVKFKKAPNLKLTSCAIVQPDEGSGSAAASSIKRLGIEKISVFKTGEQIWDYLSSETVDLVVMDWKLPELSGLALYNRIRRDSRLKHTLVIVTCSKKNMSDFSILLENPRTSLLTKPFEPGSFSKTILHFTSQHTKLEDAYALIREKIKTAEKMSIRTGDLLAYLIERQDTPPPVFVNICEYMFEEKQYELAIKVLQTVLADDPKNISALTLIGKIYHRLNQPNKAYEFLGKSNQLSPQSIERLCLLGEIKLNLNDPEKAKAFFKKASIIDPTDSKSTAGVIVAENLSNHFASHEFNATSPFKLATMLNVVGITFVRNRKYREGIQQYHAALSFVDSKELIARLQFNLGLAYIRSREFALAEVWLKKAQENASPTFIKPKKFIEKIKIYARDKSAPVPEISVDQDWEDLAA